MRPCAPRTDACLALGAAVLSVSLVATSFVAAGGPLGAVATAATRTSVVAPLGGAATTRAEPAARQQHSEIDQDLQRRLAAKMSHATAGRYGLVVDIDGVGRVASIRPGLALRPASTQKLFTTLPLLLHQPGARLVTDVVVGRAPVGGVVQGDLVVRAAADPSLTRPALDRLAQAVRHAGIRHVTGHLQLDVGGLPRRTRQQGWKTDFVPGDIGPLSPFPVAHDWWRNDQAYLAHPTSANLQKFRSRLAARGVTIHGGSEIVSSSPATVVVATHSSQPISLLIKHALRWSDNFYAELLLAVEGGHAAVRRVESDAGVSGTSQATDGSGLSYDDRQTAAGEVTLLHYAHSSPARHDLLAALPVGCRSGTLKDRFCHTAGAGTVYAKTGTLNHSRALSGYTTDGAGRLVTFSVICASVRDLYAAARAIDRAVLVLRAYTG